MRHLHRYPLAACGDYVTSGGGDIYLAVITFIAPTNTESVRVERFDPATGRSIVLGPTVATLTGSTRAHCALAYADGSLWFWGSGSPGAPSASLVRISPATGAVTMAFPSSVLPEDGAPRNVLVGNGEDLWLAGAAPGGPEVVEVLRPAQRAPSVVYTGGHFIEWVSAIGGGVWAYSYTIHTTPSNPANETTTRTRLVEIGATGAVRVVASSTLAGDGIVGTGPLHFGSVPMSPGGHVAWARKWCGSTCRRRCFLGLRGRSSVWRRVPIEGSRIVATSTPVRLCSSHRTPGRPTKRTYPT